LHCPIELLDDGIGYDLAGAQPMMRQDAASARSSDELEIEVIEAPKRRIDAAYVWLWAAAAVVALLHFAFAHPPPGPRIFADEIGYLANARYLAGGHAIDMSHTAFYAGGYSLAIAPLSRLFAHDPGRLYTSIVAMQSVLAGLSLVMIACLCRWLLAARWGAAILAAFVATLYPTLVVYTGFTWSEAMLQFALLLAITSGVWVLRSVDGKSARSILVRASLAGAACGYVITVHNRTVLGMLAFVAIVAVALARRRERPAAAAMVIGFIAIVGAGQILNSHLKSALWKGAGGVETSGRISALFHPHGDWAALRAGIGQYWYQLVATGGVVAIALTAFVLLARHPARTNSRGDADSSSRATVALAVFVTYFGLLAVSAIFIGPGGSRADAAVYGRYMDITTPLLVGVGIAWLATSPIARYLAIAAVATVVSAITAFLVLHFGARVQFTHPYNRATTISILGWLNPHRGKPMLAVATAWTVVIALGVLGITYLAARLSWRQWISPVVVAVAVASLFAWQLSFTHHRLLTSMRHGAEALHQSARAVQKTGTRELVLDSTIHTVDRLGLAFWLPDVKLIGPTPNMTCSSVVSIGHETRPPANEVEIASGGSLRLFRGVASCPG
jgi:hypothetical protein